MFIALDEYIFGCDDEPTKPPDRLRLVEEVGTKACGLALLPKHWTPPFLVLSAALYVKWRETDDSSKGALLTRELQKLEK